jgi:hypothetical protein
MEVITPKTGEIMKRIIAREILGHSFGPVVLVKGAVCLFSISAMAYCVMSGHREVIGNPINKNLARMNGVALNAGASYTRRR